MKTETLAILETLVRKRPDIAVCQDSILQTYELILDSQRANGKLLVCGNGGSAADALHLVGELMKGFYHPRPLTGDLKSKIEATHAEAGPYLAGNLQAPIRAISLVSEAALMTAVLNDNAADVVFAQQVIGLGLPGDVLLVITTSGNSRNVELAVLTAKAVGVKTIALTGPEGGRIKDVVDCIVCAPGASTHDIQEAHLPIYHALCLMLESEMFG